MFTYYQHVPPRITVLLVALFSLLLLPGLVVGEGPTPAGNDTSATDQGTIFGNPLEYLSGLEAKLQAAGEDREAVEEVLAEARTAAAAALAQLDDILARLKERETAGAQLELAQTMRRLAAEGAAEVETRWEHLKALAAATEQKSIARKRRLEAEDEERASGVELAKIADSDVTPADVDACAAAYAALERQLSECRSRVEIYKQKRIAARNLVTEYEKQLAAYNEDVETARKKLADAIAAEKGSAAEVEARMQFEIAHTASVLAQCRLLHARIALDIIQVQVETTANAQQEAILRLGVAGRKLAALRKRREAIELAEEDARLRSERERLLEQERRLAQLARETTSALQKELLDEERINIDLKKQIAAIETDALKFRAERSRFAEDTVAVWLAAIRADKEAMHIRRPSPSDFIEKRRKAEIELSQLNTKLEMIASLLASARQVLTDLETRRPERLESSASRMEQARGAQTRAAVLAETLQPADRTAVLNEWDRFLTRLAEILKERNELHSNKIRAQSQLCSHLDGFLADIGDFQKELQSWLAYLDERYSRLTTRIGDVEIPLSPWIVVSIGVALLVVLFFLLNFIGVRIWERWLGKETQPGRLPARKAVKRISLFFMLVAIPVLAANLLAVPEKVLVIVNKTAFVLVIAVCAYLLGKLVLFFLYRFTTRGGQSVALTGPLVALVRTALVVIGGLIILDTIGISITPLLTTLGIGSVAVALALQDTLSNFFAGLYITADKPVRVGDYVKLENLAEGYVVSISWRSTRIRTRKNNLIVIPNQKLAQSIVQNYSLPEQRMTVLVPVNVSYESDPQHVERVLCEEAIEATKTVPGLLAEPAPFVRFLPGFGESSLGFTIVCQVREFGDQYLVQHELHKRIFARFKKEGIQIPFPHRTIYVKSEKKEESNARGDRAFSTSGEATEAQENEGRGAYPRQHSTAPQK